jgi:hypothetical protein
MKIIIPGSGNQITIAPPMARCIIPGARCFPVFAIVTGDIADQLRILKFHG